MDITIDIEKELAEAQDTRQVTVDGINKLVAERQALIAETLKPIQSRLNQIDAPRQNLIQEALRQDGEVRHLQRMKDKAAGVKKEKPKKKKTKKT